MQPDIRYTKSGYVHIAYQVFGAGPRDLVYIPGFISNIESYWEWPEWRGWLHRIGTQARVIMFDKRGTGLSDRLGQLPNLDQRMDDARAVMDAAGSKRAALLGVAEGGSLATLFAGTHPERCSALILCGAFARFSDWFPTRQKLDAFSAMSTRLGAAAPALYLSPHPRKATSTFSAFGPDGKGRAAARRRC